MTILRCLVFSALGLIAFLISQSSQSYDDQDTSLYDWVAYNLFEDYVDLLEMTTWYARRVKDHIDEVLEEAFVSLTKQQEMLQPALQLAEKYNRLDCSDGKIMNVTDAVFREFFNMNINCPMIGQKMAIYFNELHNVTALITAAHRRHIHLAAGCGPPHIENVERNCLQNIVKNCKRETSEIRNHLMMLNYDVEEFMDGQIEEALGCTLKSMSYVRNVTKQAVQDIHCCLDIEESYEINHKYSSPMLEEAMGRLKGRFDHIDISKEKKDRMAKLPGPSQQFHPPHPGGPTRLGMTHPYQPPLPPHPSPQHPQFHAQPGMAHPPPAMHPGVAPQYIQQHPGVQPQFVHNPGMQHQQQGFQQPLAGNMHPWNPLKPDSKSLPPWRTDPKNIPNYADKDYMGEGSFDASFFEENENMFGNVFGEEISDDGDFNQDIDHVHDSL